MRPSTPLADDRFRVIVVGAGVAGLAASHCLQKAGINHVVVEKGPEAAPAEGASIAIYPHGARILDQFGALEEAKAACTPMQRYKNRGPDGKVLADSGFFDYIKENFGEDILLLERRRFLQILYDTLPDKSPILFQKRVADIVDDYQGVTVTFTDGSVERGDMVMGCDGVNSKVRELMWRNANLASPGSISAKEKTSVSTSWKCLVGMGPPNAGMGQRDMTCVHNDGFSFLALSQPDSIFYFVFFRLDAPIVWPNRPRYTDADAEKLAASVAGYPVSDSVLFGELWQKRYRGGLIPLEEGILEQWFSGRVVLAGDSAHKITPNIALGGNSSLESVVVLTNELHALLTEHGGAKPSRAALGRIFKKYQAQRIPRMRQILDYSSTITKLQAWDNPLLKLVATWVVPYLPDNLIANDLSTRVVATAPKLSFVKVSKGFGKDAKIKFADEIESSASTVKAQALKSTKGEATPNVSKVNRMLLQAMKKPQEGEMMRFVWALMTLFGVAYWISHVN